MSKLQVLVYGASGQQGGAVARRLIARGHQVTTLARDPDSPKLAALRAQGIHIVRGDIEDVESVSRAAQGKDAIFALTTPFERGPQAEIAQGQALVRAAQAASVRHVAFSSVGSANQATGVAHFDSKYEVEKLLAAAGVPHTVIAPVYFMENLFFPQVLAGLGQGVYAQALPPSRTLQQIATADIALVAVHVLESREAFLGQRLDIAGDELSGEQQAAALSRALGRPIQFQPLPISALRSFSEEMATMYEWFERVGYRADIAAVRRLIPGLRTFEQWLGEQDLSRIR